MKNASKKITKIKILGLIATIALPIWVSISQAPIGKVYESLNKKYFQNSPFLGLGIWLFITITLWLLYEWRESLINQNQISDEDKRADTIQGLRKNYTERLKQKMASDITFEINLSLSFSNEEAEAKIIDWFIIDGLEDREINGFDGLFEVFRNEIKRLAIIGDAGSGKSVLMHKFAIRLLDIAAQDPLAPIPFILDLATLEMPPVKSSSSLELSGFMSWLELAVSEKCEDAGLANSRGAELVRKKQIIPFLDGFDEIPAEKYNFRPKEDYLQLFYQYAEEVSHEGDKIYPELLLTSRINDFKLAQYRAGVSPVKAIIKINPIEDIDVELARLIAKDAKGTAYRLKRAVDYYPHLKPCLNTAFNLHIALKLAREHFDFSSVKDEESLLDAYMMKRLKRVEDIIPVQNSIDGMQWIARHADRLRFSKLTINSDALGTNILFTSFKYLLFSPLIPALVYLVFLPYSQSIFSNPHFKPFPVHRSAETLAYYLAIASFLTAISLSDKRSGFELYPRPFDYPKVLRKLGINFGIIAFLLLSFHTANMYAEKNVAIIVLLVVGYYGYEHINDVNRFSVRSHRTIKKVLLLDFLNTAICITGILTSLYIFLTLLIFRQKFQNQIGLAPPVKNLIPAVVCLSILLAFPGSYVFDGWLTRKVLGFKKLMPAKIEGLLLKMNEQGILEFSGGFYRFRHLLIRNWFIANGSVQDLELVRDNEGIIGVKNNDDFPKHFGGPSV